MKWKVHRITFEFDEEKCNCGLAFCVEACGQGVLDFVEESDKMEVVNTVQCIFCRQCEDVCPTKAIIIHGTLTLQDVRGLESQLPSAKGEGFSPLPRVRQ